MEDGARLRTSRHCSVGLRPTPTLTQRRHSWLAGTLAPTVVKARRLTRCTHPRATELSGFRGRPAQYDFRGKAVAIDQIETVTGINFMPQIAEPNALEQAVNNAWLN